ncbi:MAG: helix-turn-helix domain-containing protein [Bacteroidia bacterium]
MKPVHVLNITQFRDSGHEDFHANTLENHLITRHKDISEPHSHNFYLSVLFTQGSGTHEIDFTTYTVKPGALFFLNPGQTHHWHLSENTKGFIFFHTREFYESFFTGTELRQYPFFYSTISNPVFYLDEKQKKNITTSFEKIFEEFIQTKAMQKQALISLVSLLYVDCSRIVSMPVSTTAENKNSYYQKFRQFEDLVEYNYLPEKSPAFYAGKLSVTLRHLNRISQAVAGKTAGDVIAGRILLEAKKELVLHRGNFKNIAHMLGYEDYAYFSRFFKTKTGETPSDFIKRYTKNT